MSLSISIRSEFLKSRRTASVYLTIAGALLVPLMFTLDATLGSISPENMRNPLAAFFRESFTIVTMVILPVFIVLITTLLPQIEYRNNSWKQVFASPQSLSAIYFSKFLNVQFLIILFLLIFNGGLFSGIVIIHFFAPAIQVFSYPMDWNDLLFYNLNAYIAVAGISAFQFCLGIKLRNFIMPIAIGLVLIIFGGILVFDMQAPFAKIYPHAFPALISLPADKSINTQILFTSLAYTFIFLSLGFAWFKSRKVRA